MEQTVSWSHLETEGRGARWTNKDLLNTLEELTKDEFKLFKWYLKDDRSIKVYKLEDADRMETVDLMVKTYKLHGAVNMTRKVLKEIARTDLLQNLSASSSESEVSVDVKCAGGAPENRGVSSSQTEALSSNHLRALDLTHHQMSAVRKVSVDVKDAGGAPENRGASSSQTEALSSNHLRELDLTHHQTSAGVQLSREDLRKYSCELTVDTNTVSRRIKLSDNNRKMTYVKEDQSYPDHPERFEYSFWCQMLCRTGLTGRCYWEVEWSGWVTISVSYRGISRRGVRDDCLFGRNNQSWSLWCFNDDGRYSVWHNDRRTDISSSSSSSSSSGRVAAYVDCPAGTLSFYRVSSDLLIHLHTFNTTFTEPLYPGFGFRLGSGSSVSLCDV